MAEAVVYGDPHRQPAPDWHQPRRHPYETLLYLLAALFALAAMAAAGYAVTDALVNDDPTVPDWALLLLVIPVLAWLGRAVMRAQQRTSSIRITPTQFPEAHAMVVEAAHRFGLKRVPDAYVQLGNGVINAMASAHGRRRYIVLYSDLFEVGGRARNPEALRFVVGHEVGHIAARHTSYPRTLVGMTVSRFPVIGPAWSRAQEYTADNHGMAFAPDGAATAMGLMGAGKYLLNQVDFNALCDRSATERGFFVWLVNLMGSHPVLTWRAAALRDRSSHGRLLFRPRPRPPVLAGPPVEPVPFGPVPVRPPVA